MTDPSQHGHDEGPVPIGMVLAGKYELVRLLGKGGMGAVYEGRNRATLKRCAVKLLVSPLLGSNVLIVKRFFREARASSIVESDHIVTIYDSGVDPQTGYPFMVMELLHGEDLEGTVKRLGALSPLAAVKLVLQAAIGLGKAHDQGIVHRDIKPANLFLTQRETGDYVVKLLDFGIAKVKMESVAETSSGLTRTGSMMGTPLYMSPEQAVSSPSIDARSDVWSLGVVLYELLCGRIPYEHATSLGELMVSIITHEVPPLQDQAPWVPAEIAAVVHRAMSKDLAVRYPDANALREALIPLSGDGPRLHAALLTGVSEQERGAVAVRLTAAPTSHGNTLTTRSGLAVTAAAADEARPSKRSRRWGAPAALLGAAAVVGVAVGVQRLGAKDRAPAAPLASTTQAAPATSAASMPGTIVAPAAVDRKYALLVAPKDVVVSVDGAKLEVRDGKVEFSGRSGTTREVRLERGDTNFEQVVALTDLGLLPDKVELPASRPAAKPASSSAKAGKARPDAAVDPKPKADPAAVKPEVPKAKLPVADDTTEFN